MQLSPLGKAVRVRDWVFGLIMLSVPSLTALGEEASVLQIDDRRELFVDHFLVESLDGARLKMHTPQLQPAIATPRPHGHYATVLKAKDKFQFYYRGDTKPGNHWKKGWEQYHEGEVTLYAESKDAISWTLPRLGRYKDHPTFPRGNVVLQDEFLVTHNFTPFIDTRPGVPAAEKYKGLGGLAYQPHKEHQEVRKRRGPGGLKAFVSPDGVNWRKLQESPVIPEAWGKYFDSQNYAFWSSAEQAYVCYFRRFIKGYRGIARTTSKDFVHWTPFVEMQANLPNEHLYTACTQPYFRAPHIYLALPTRFHGEARVRHGYFVDEYARRQSIRSSVHGIIYPTWDRPDGWANRANYAAIGIHQTSPAEISLFLTGGRRYTLRIDGFVSVNAPLAGGELTTKPFKFRGGKLELNYATSAAGELSVELRDAHGAPIRGFRHQDCIPIYGDHIARIVKWEGDPDLSELNGRAVLLHFRMSDADLYSLRFHE